MIDPLGRVIRLALVLCLTLGPWVPEAAAQPPPVGTRVRVTAAGALGKPTIGDVLAVNEQTLTIINKHGERVSVEREFVTKLEMSMGQKRHLVAGLLMGAVGGLAAGSLGPRCGGLFSSSTPCYTRADLVKRGVLFWGAFGAGLGWA